MMKKKYFILISFIFISMSITYASNNQVTFDPNDLKLAIRYPSLTQKTATRFTFNNKEASFNFETENQVLLEEKSKGKAFLFSLLLPGAGEYYLGSKTTAKAFFITELVLWASYFSFQTYSDWKRDDMYIMASTHADADIKDKPSQYFVDLGNFNDIYEYNDFKQRQREFFDIYPVEDYFWSWDSEASRNKFEQLRISSDRARNRSIFAIGSIIANHLISAIDAVWRTYRYNKKLNKKVGFQIRFDAKPYGGFSMSIQKSF